VETLGVMAGCLAILPAAYLIVQQQPSLWGLRLSDRELTLPDLALLYSFLAGVLDPARKLSSVFSKLKKATAACDRVFAWMDQPQRTFHPALPQSVRHSRTLTFDRVTFHYQARPDAVGRRQPVLDDVSFSIPFGEVVAIVGGNGSGKSTLVGLLPRFYEPASGRVLIDGVEIGELSLRGLREQLGWVPQDPLLFDASLAENIAYGRPDSTRAEIEQVARKAHVWDFAAAWPQGLDTPIGERGSRLSGGQRQRVALARAMLRQPAILVLDEATSAVDAQSEQLIYESLAGFRAGRTTLIITHQITPALLNMVDRIAVLQAGRLVGLAGHAALLATCPAYQSLFDGPAARAAA
jgi:subfamily B ATP-binding cassette protein MsbA